jgi:hypothetical protein
MTKKEVTKCFDSLLNSNTVLDLIKFKNNAFLSGAIEMKDYETPMVLAKVIMKAALFSMAAQVNLPERYDKEVSNLQLMV